MNASLGALIFASFSLKGAEELSTYEVPESTKDVHEEQFYNDSCRYESALSKLQIVFVVDKSGSQGAPDAHPQGLSTGKGMLGDTWTQWDNTFYAAKYLAESVFEYDADGKVPLVFFGYNAEDKVVENAGQMLVAFKKNKPTRETTNLLDALQLGFNKYSKPSSPDEKILFIVLTDGCPNPGQPAQVKSLIQRHIQANHFSGDQFNILFLRIGDDPGAVAFLQDLDDCKDIGDWVDTKSDNMMYQMGPKNLILNAIYEHLDSKYQEQ